METEAIKSWGAGRISEDTKLARPTASQRLKFGGIEDGLSRVVLPLPVQTDTCSFEVARPGALQG